MLKVETINQAKELQPLTEAIVDNRIQRIVNVELHQDFVLVCTYDKRLGTHNNYYFHYKGHEKAPTIRSFF